VNVEIAPACAKEARQGAPEAPPGSPAPAAVDTPGARTVKEVASFLSIDEKNIIKTIIVVYEDKAAAALVRGDRELNLLKLSGLLGKKEIFLAGDAEVERVTRAPVGFAGPVGLDIPVYADFEVMEMKDAACGANQADRHLIHVFPGRDFKAAAWADLRRVEEGDACPRCGRPLHTEKGIEGGQTFYLGTLYSEKMNALFIDQDGKQKPFDMGCYGIGITRLAAAVVEQKNDERGIIWPVSVAPFETTVLPLGGASRIHEAAQALADRLEEAHLSVLFDDRDESPGVKFYDADLLGMPLQVIVGSKAMKEGKVELRLRDGSRKEMVPLDGAVEAVVGAVRDLHAGLAAYASDWEGKILKVAAME
jgi:prolyl-tRNA synthetase